MDRIDSFVITGHQIGGVIDFTFVITEEDTPIEERKNLIDYIENFIHLLNKKAPQFEFTWSEAHKIEPGAIIEEVIHQILVQGVFN